jgi:hypothetical protein
MHESAKPLFGGNRRLTVSKLPITMGLQPHKTQKPLPYHHPSNIP